MALPKKYDFNDYDNYLTDPNPTTSAEAQNYFRNMDMLVTAMVDTFLWQPGTNYANGDVVKSPSMPNGAEAVCVAEDGGKSSNVEPRWGNVGGENIADGTCFWKLRWEHWSKDIATQAEAEAGTDNATVMTPLRVKNAIDKNCPIKTFEGVESLGLNKQTITWQMIYSNLPNSSEFFFATNSEDAPLLNMPYAGYMRFEVVKVSEYAVVYGYFWGTKITHIAFFDENEFSGWKRLATTDNIPAIATQTQAETGTDNTTVITPKGLDNRLKKDRTMASRTNVYSLGVTDTTTLTWGELSNKLNQNYDEITKIYQYVSPAEYPNLQLPISGFLEITGSGTYTVTLTSHKSSVWYIAGYSTTTGFTGWKKCATNGALSMPSNQKINLNIEHGDEYTAPCDGWFFTRFDSTVNSKNFHSIINLTNGLQDDLVTTTTITEIAHYMPCSKGDVVKAEWGKAYTTIKEQSFIYAQSEV